MCLARKRRRRNGRQVQAHRASTPTFPGFMGSSFPFQLSSAKLHWEIWIRMPDGLDMHILDATQVDPILWFLGQATPGLASQAQVSGQAQGAISHLVSKSKEIRVIFKKHWRPRWRAPHGANELTSLPRTQTGSSASLSFFWKKHDDGQSASRVNRTKNPTRSG